MAISPLYSSLNGSYNAAADMASVALQRSQITSGSYGRLMKAYVKQVGNKAALNAYRSTGSTTASVSSVASGSTDTTSTVSTKKTVQRSNFLDNHLKSIGKTTTSTTTAAGKSFLDKHLNSVDTGKTTGLERAIQHAEQATGRAINSKGEFVDLADKYKEDETSTTTLKTLAAPDTDQYEKLRSTWLDDHLKSYDKDATQTTVANYSVALDVSV